MNATDGGAQPKRRRRPQQRSLDTQRKLIEAATAAFAERGFEGTSTRDIAERAGVHHPLITYHFKSKEALWRAAAERLFAELGARLDACLERHRESAGSFRLRALLREFVRYSAETPELHRLMVQESADPGPRLEWLLETQVRPMFERRMAEIGALQAAGILPPGSPAMLHYVLFGAAASVFSLGPEYRRLSGEDPQAPETAERLADLLERVFFRDG